jgi:hypothetical protein
MGQRTGGWYGERVSSFVSGNRERLGAVGSNDGEGEQDSSELSHKPAVTCTNH